MTLKSFQQEKCAKCGKSSSLYYTKDRKFYCWSCWTNERLG